MADNFEDFDKRAKAMSFEQFDKLAREGEATKESGGLFAKPTKAGRMPPFKDMKVGPFTLPGGGPKEGERVGELAPGAKEPDKFTDPNEVVRLAVGGLALGGIAPVAASMGAPTIAATALPARMAVGVTPTAVEPTVAAIAAKIAAAAGATGAAAKRIVENPKVQELAKWLARGAVGATGFEGARRLFK